MNFSRRRWPPLPHTGGAPLTPSQPPITRTTHTLPFDKLSPCDFERLCLWLVEREGYQRAKQESGSCVLEEISCITPS